MKKSYFISCDGATLPYANTNFTPFDQTELKKMLNSDYDNNPKKTIKSFAKKKGHNLFFVKKLGFRNTFTRILIFLHVQKLEAFWPPEAGLKAQ